MHRHRFASAPAAGRKAWHAPRLARLAAGSAEDGSATEEDGNFNAS